MMALANKYIEIRQRPWSYNLVKKRIDVSSLNKFNTNNQVKELQKGCKDYLIVGVVFTDDKLEEK